MIHPLLTKISSAHYDNKIKPKIYFIEKDNTLREMIGACNYNIAKYTDRTKGQDKEDAIKKASFEAYKAFLVTIVYEVKIQDTCNTRYAIDKVFPKLKYSL